MSKERKDTENYFSVHADLGIVGRGATVETCFTHLAKSLFSLIAEIKSVHITHIINFDFTEESLDKALYVWLATLLQKAEEHQLFFGDFRLQRQGNIWHATVSGESMVLPKPLSIRLVYPEPGMVFVRKTSQSWEARCLLDVSKSAVKMKI